MGPQKCGIVGKSQPVLIMINPMIFTRTRSAGWPGGVSLGGVARRVRARAFARGEGCVAPYTFFRSAAYLSSPVGSTRRSPSPPARPPSPTTTLLPPTQERPAAASAASLSSFRRLLTYVASRSWAPPGLHPHRPTTGVIEAPWLVNGGHGASLRHHKRRRQQGGGGVSCTGGTASLSGLTQARRTLMAVLTQQSCWWPRRRQQGSWPP
jgi:hypothetical protein